MKQIFPGIFKKGKKLYTINLVPGSKVYGEVLIKYDKKELREWDPTRSKLAAAILNGLKQMPIKNESKVLYLGASTGTTCSHISDIIGFNGFIYAVEIAERVMRKLLNLATKRKNIMPILADARKPGYEWIEEVDIVYVDIADPQETQIAIRNAREFLRKHGYLMIAIKSQSIDVTLEPAKIYEQERKKLEEAGFSIIDIIDLEPYEHDHCFILARVNMFLRS